MPQAISVNEQRFEPLLCHNLTRLYAGALFESVFFKKGAVFHMQIFHEIEGAVLLVLMIIKAAPFFCSPQNQKGRQPKEVGK